MAAKKNKKTPVTREAAPFVSIDFSVVPRPLAAPNTGNPEIDELASVLASNTPAQLDAAKRFRMQPKKLDGAALASLLTDDALDLGVVRWDGAAARTLPAKERRAYRAAYDAAYGGRIERMAWLMTVATAAAHHDEGAVRLGEIVRSHADPYVRQLVAGALIKVRPDDRAALDAIATLIAIEGVAIEMIGAHTLGACAILRRDRRAAYDELAALLLGDLAAAVVQGVLGEAPRIDERWLDTLLPILGTGRLNLDFTILAILVKLPSEPRMLEHVLRQAGDPAKATFIAPQTILALAHCRDARATPLLLRALVVATENKGLVLEALRAAGDPAAAPAIRAFVEEQRRSPHATQLGGIIDLGVAAITDLERRGPIAAQKGGSTSR